MPTKNQKTPTQDMKMLSTYLRKDAPVEFSDYVEVKLSGEHVLLSFCRRDPDDPESQAEVLNRIYMTIPHYLRFVTLGNENLKKLRDAGVIEKIGGKK